MGMPATTTSLNQAQYGFNSNIVHQNAQYMQSYNQTPSMMPPQSAAMTQNNLNMQQFNNQQPNSTYPADLQQQPMQMPVNFQNYQK
jgi:hypothetical protein